MKQNTIIIFGLTGSGKSTLAQQLGKKLRLRVIHPSSILKDLLQGTIPNISDSQAGTGFWESPEGMSLFENRLKSEKPLDFVCDEILLKEIAKGNVVMDSWTMPWLASSGIKICLTATIKNRAARVALRGGLSIHEARRIITLRDSETRKLYLDRFDIKKDHHVFDVTIVTDGKSSEEVLDEVLNILEK